MLGWYSWLLRPPHTRKVRSSNLLPNTRFFCFESGNSSFPRVIRISSTVHDSSASRDAIRGRATTAARAPRAAPRPPPPGRGVRGGAGPAAAAASRECRHYVNLKNGIEALPTLRDDLGVRSYEFVRIQSSLLENGDCEKMILELDASLLLNLALGRSCFVWDFGSRDVVKGRGNPRALWYGAEFIRYALRKEWFPEGVGDAARRENVPVVRGKQVEREWATKLTMFGRSAKRKIRYYRQFIPDDVRDVRLIGVYRPTTHDDDAEYYREVLLRHEFGDGGDVPDVVRDERETIEAIERLSYNIFFAGVEEPAWLNQK